MSEFKIRMAVGYYLVLCYQGFSNLFIRKKKYVVS